MSIRPSLRSRNVCPSEKNKSALVASRDQKSRGDSPRRIDSFIFLRSALREARIGAILEFRAAEKLSAIFSGTTPSRTTTPQRRKRAAARRRRFWVNEPVRYSSGVGRNINLFGPGHGLCAYRHPAGFDERALPGMSTAVALFRAVSGAPVHLVATQTADNASAAPKNKKNMSRLRGALVRWRWRQRGHDAARARGSMWPDVASKRTSYPK